MHEALVLGSGKRMRTESGNGRFCCHARVPDAVRTRHGTNIEPLQDIGRRPDLLVDFYMPAAAHDPDARVVPGNC